MGVPVLERQRLTGRRFRTYRSIYRFCEQEKRDTDTFWHLPHNQLRRTRGEGLRGADVEVPYMLSERTRRVIAMGVEALLVLARMRHRQWVGTSEWDGILRTDAYDQLDDAPRPSWHLPEVGPGLSPERVAASSAAIDSWLDPGLVIAWLAPARPGGKMLSEIESIYREAFLEERNISIESREPTSYLVHLAMARELGDQWRTGLKQVHSAAFAERMGLAGAVLIHAVLEVAVSAAFENPAVVDTSLINVRTEYLLRTCMSPLTFMPAGSSAQIPYIYGLEPDIVGYLQRRTAEVSIQTGDLEAHVHALTDWAMEQDGLADQITVQASLEEVRHAALVLASILDSKVEDTAPEFGRLASDPQTARHKLLNAEQRTLLIETLEQLSQRRPEAAEAAVDLAAAVTPGVSATALKPETIQTRVREAVRAYVVLECDRRARNSVDNAMKTMIDVVREQGEAEASARYLAGEIYRFGGDDRPIVQEKEQRRDEGQLFIDLSEFVKRTAQISANLADMLASGLYTPILAAAAEIRSAGSRIDVSGVRADAMAFYGDVEALITLVPRIRMVLERYRKDVEAKVPKQVMEERLKKIEADVATAREQLASRRDKVTKLLHDVDKSIGDPTGDTTGTLRLGASMLAEIRRLQNELFRIEEEESALDRDAAKATESVEGRDLEAGMFISHGPSASTIDLDGAEWTIPRIFISPTSNVAEHGTTRSEIIERRLQLVVRHAREMRGRDDIVYPFRVYLDKVWSVPIPPALVPEFRFAVDERNPDEAERLFGELSRRASLDFTEAAASRGPLRFRLINATHDLYNAGCALTEAGLLAYREAADTHTHFFQRDVALSELNAAFHERFAFGRARLKLVFAVPRGHNTPRYIFREVGSMVFRRYDGRKAVGVYEVLEPADPFYQLLIQHHFKWWWQERRDSKVAPIPRG